MKRYYALTVLFIIIITPVILNAQGVDYLESQLNYYNQLLTVGTAKLDSLQRILENKAGQITREKTKKDNNNDKIISLMSGSATLSNKIETQQYKVQEISKNLEYVKEKLYSQYTNIIDSLKKFQTRVKPGKDLKIINDKILNFTEKRLLVSPKINSLTFDPQKLIEVNLNSIGSQNEKIMYSNYLKNALSEINQQLSNVENSFAEVQQIIYLQNKARRFLEETEFDNEITPMRRQNINAANTQETSYDNTAIGTPKGAIELELQAQSYSLLLNQLNFDRSSKWNTKEVSRKDFSLKAYQAMLKELKNKLQDYKSVLKNKLDNN
jgi:hypothetical protein